MHHLNGPLLFRLPRIRWTTLLLAGIFCATVGGTVRCMSQTSRPQRSPAATQAAENRPEALSDLQNRMRTAELARSSGDPKAVDDASRKVIALAYRHLAHLRLTQGRLDDATELYLQSLRFDDTADTRVDLAVTYLRNKNTEDSLAEAARALLEDPQSARAWHAQGKAFMMKREDGKAADALARSLVIHWDPEAAYSLAVCLLAEHEQAKAAAVFQQMRDAAPGHLGVLHVLFARAYRDAGYLPDAVRELKTALQIDPKTPHAHYFLGLVYLLQEEWAPSPEIRRQFLLELQLNPKDFLSNYLLGAMQANAKNYAESDHYLTIATKIAPSWPESWIYLGLNAYGQGQNQQAESYLRKAIALTGKDESRSNYFVRKAYFALGRVLIQSGRREEARPYIQKAGALEQQIQKESRESMAAKGMGNEPLSLPADDARQEALTGDGDGEREPGAKADASLRARTNPATPSAASQSQESVSQEERRLREILGVSFNDLATSEAMRAQYAQALADYREAQRWYATLSGLDRNLGIAALRAEDYVAASNTLPSVLSANPADTLVRAMLGTSYYMTERYKDAARTIAPLGDAAIKDRGLAYAWADSLIKSEQLSAAKGIIEKMETGEGRPSLDTLMQVGRLWGEMGDYVRAEDTFHRVLQQDPKHLKAHYYAGLACLRSDHPVEAASEFRAELSLSPFDIEAKYDLGFSLLQQSKRDEATAVFSEVLSSAPQHPGAQYQLGKILLDEGRVEEAIPHLEMAARSSPQSDYVHYQLQAAYRKQSRLQEADRELAIYKELKAQNRKRTAPHPDATP